MNFEWSDFTKKYINNFIDKKYKLKKHNNLYKYIINEYTNINLFINENENKININIIPYENIDYKFIKYSHTKWVDKNVINEINKIKYTYLITWNKNKIYLKTDIEYNSELNLLQRLKWIIYIIEYLKNKSNNYFPIKMFLVMSSLKKEFPINEIICPKHSNSGYTDHRNNIIFIWRKEEMEKVIFHEIIHYLKIDKYHELDYELFNIDGPHSYYESITDYQAIIYNIIYLSIITKISTITLLKIELGFIENQALYLNDLLNLNSWENIPDNNIKQNTPAFSYYILKYLIFKYSINNDINYIKNYNTIFTTGINMKNYLKIKSARMTLFELN